MFINAKALKAACIFHSKPLAYGTLGNVLVEINEHGYDIAATDSYELFHAKQNQKADETSVQGKFLLNAVQLNDALKNTDRCVTIDHVKEEYAELSIYNVKGEKRYARVNLFDGTFPNYKQLLPESPANIVKGSERLNAGYMANACKAAKIINGKSAWVDVAFIKSNNKTNDELLPVWLTIADDWANGGIEAFVLIMPIRR